MNIDDIIFNEGLFDTINKATAGEINKTVFINELKKFLEKFKTYYIDFDNKKAIKQLQGVCNDLDSSNYDIDVLLKVLKNVQDDMLLAKKTSRTLKNFKEMNMVFDLEKSTIPTLKHKVHKLLDNFIYNGLIVIGGLSNSGKTTFTIDMILDNISALSETERKDTYFIFYTLDDSIEKIYYKMIKMGHVRGVREWVENNVLCDDSLDYNMLSVMRQRISELIQQNKKVIVMIDYLQLIKVPDLKYKKDYIDRLVFELKSITKDFNIAMYLLSQLSRSKEGKYNYRESSEIENQAEICIDIEKQDDGLIGVWHKKNKEFKCGELYITEIINNLFTYKALMEGMREKGGILKYKEGSF